MSTEIHLRPPQDLTDRARGWSKYVTYRKPTIRLLACGTEGSIKDPKVAPHEVLSTVARRVTKGKGLKMKPALQKGSCTEELLGALQTFPDRRIPKKDSGLGEAKQKFLASQEPICETDKSCQPACSAFLLPSLGGRDHGHFVSLFLFLALGLRDIELGTLSLPASYSPPPPPHPAPGAGEEEGSVFLSFPFAIKDEFSQK
ncbi:uncharacterized protein LOC135974071 [Chrysemys picta bellii]|uniref:uncharacterized protein LOC135974071 n=1 Tax=Chrysemys picta bellii TaxID=8478 RepID=UPI0032B1D716